MNRPNLRHIPSAISVSIVLICSLWAIPTLAKDPFRVTRQHQIGDKTEATFNAVFRDGNYVAAQNYVKQALVSEPNEPLLYGMAAAFAYTNKDNDSLSSYSQKTLDSAQKLVAIDPLRGNIYLAVGHFLQGATILVNQGTVNGASGALDELRQVYDYLDKAQAIDSTDPELNLVRGYMDLAIAVNVPFSSPDQALERLQKYAAPRYLAQRGLALGHRDLGQNAEALVAVEQALKAAPNNPELYYLKAQILVKQGQSQNNPALYQEALNNFNIAVQKKNQLPASIARQIERERQRDLERLNRPT